MDDYIIAIYYNNGNLRGYVKTLTDTGHWDTLTCNDEWRYYGVNGELKCLGSWKTAKTFSLSEARKAREKLDEYSFTKITRISDLDDLLAYNRKHPPNFNIE